MCLCCTFSMCFYARALLCIGLPGNPVVIFKRLDLFFPQRLSGWLYGGGTVSTSDTFVALRLTTKLRNLRASTKCLCVCSHSARHTRSRQSCSLCIEDISTLLGYATQPSLGDVLDSQSKIQKEYNAALDI